MSRMRSLRTWLSLGLVAAIVAPVTAGAGTWLAAREWQTEREYARARQAVQLVASSPLDTDADRRALSAGLTRLGVEAQISINAKAMKASLAANGMVEPQKPPDPLLVAPGLEALVQVPEFKQRVNTDYVTTNVSLSGVDATLFVGRQSVAARWAIALGVAAAALAVVLLFAVGLLRRWVLRPLARLAADAERDRGRRGW